MMFGESSGRVVGLYTAPAAATAMDVHDELEAVAGRGVVGDRYFAGTGTFSRDGKQGQDLTLIEQEALDALGAQGLALDGADARRNVLTVGIDLNALVGERFLVGDVECYAQRLCDPCSHLQRLTEPGVLRTLVHRGGLRADVLRGGTVRVGDPVRRATT
jgi:MOSC domain-containing protein YiiM